MIKCICCVKESAIRDMQICGTSNTDDAMSGDWYDAKLPAYLGVYEGDNLEEIRKKAAKYACTVPENILMQVIS